MMKIAMLVLSGLVAAQATNEFGEKFLAENKDKEVRGHSAPTAQLPPSLRLP